MVRAKRKPQKSKRARRRYSKEELMNGAVALFLGMFKGMLEAGQAPPLPGEDEKAQPSDKLH